jgi:rhamnosyltransferase
MPAICAIVVTYQPEPGLDLEGQVAALREQGAGVLLVDNASEPAARQRIEALAGSTGATTIFNPRNIGLAAALNQGIEHAAAAGYEWLATFDQDSRIMPGYFTAMWGALAAHPQPDRVGIMGPRFLHPGARTSSFAKPGSDLTLPYAPAWQAITSGSVIPLRLFKTVGLFREDFFIDYIDHEFCLRCRLRSWQVIEVGGAVLRHRQGTPKQHRLGWMRPVVTHHTPARYFYQTRNRLVVYREYGAFDPRWLARDLKETIRVYMKMLLFERQRWAKLVAILRGCGHGLIGRMGVAT